MNKIKILQVISLFLVMFSVSYKSAYALSAEGLGIITQLGSMTTTENILVFVFNAIVYFGWLGVILGVALAIWGLIYNLITSDSDKSMTLVRSYIIRAVVLIVVGLLLMSAGFIANSLAVLWGGYFDLDFTKINHK